MSGNTQQRLLQQYALFPFVERGGLAGRRLGDGDENPVSFSGAIQINEINERERLALREMVKHVQPTIFTKAIADRICRRIADGASLRLICQDKEFPHRDTVRRWLRRKPDFRAKYAEARIFQAEHFIDEIAEIADTDDNPSRARVRIDARKWVAARLAPGKYGDRSEIELSGRVDIVNRLERARERIEDDDKDK